VAALFAVAASNAHCTHRAWLAASRIREVANSSQSPSAWDDLAFDFSGNPAEAFQQPPAWRKRGIRVLLSDLLWLGDPLSALQPLSHGAAAVIVVQLLGQADMEPPTAGNIRLRDVENDERLEMFIDAVARSRYTDALTAHQQNWHRACRQVGAVFVTLVAERVLGDWSLPALEAAQILEPA